MGTWPSDAVGVVRSSPKHVERAAPRMIKSPITLSLPLRLRGLSTERGCDTGCCAVLYAGAPGAFCDEVPIWELSEWTCPDCDRDSL